MTNQTDLNNTTPMKKSIFIRLYSWCMTKEIIITSSILAGLLGIYLLVVARPVLSGRYTFGGDTYFYWSFRHLILYSIRHFNELPWWDPTNFGGYPLYFYFLSGWSNYLGPFTLLSLILFKLADTLFTLPIYWHMVFHQVMWVVGLNILAIYLIARELTKNRVAALLPPFIFILSYYQLLNFHDYYAYEAMVAPLFYLYGLIRFNNNRSSWNLIIFMLFTALLFASLQNGIVMSAFYWTACFTILLICFNMDILKDIAKAARDLCASRSGTLLFVTVLLLMLAGLSAAWSPFHINAGHILKYKGGFDGNQPVAYNVNGGLTDNYNIPFKTSEIWTVLMNWLPFPDVHNTMLGFIGDGHENRYIGLVTLPLLLTAFTLCLRNRYVYILSLAYFICNAFFIYATDNIAYRILTDTSDIFRNVANVATIFPRGGASLLLVFAAAIGLDRLVSVSTEQETERGSDVQYQQLFKRGQLFIIFSALALLAIGIVSSKYEKLAPIRHSLSHTGIYLLFFAFSLRLLFSSNHPLIRKSVIAIIFVFCFMDLTISQSAFLLSRAPQPFSGLQYGYPSSPVSNNILLPMPDLIQQGATVPETTSFRAARSEEERMFPEGFRGVFHNWRRINWSTKEWLVLATRPEGRSILENWNYETANPKGYPFFRFFSNGVYVPLDILRDIDSNKQILAQEFPIYLHDENLVKKHSGTPPAWVQGSYLISTFTPNIVELKTRTDSGGFLYYLDNYDKYWKAYLDGKEVPVHRANFTYKAVEVPAGEHQVRWVYSPWPVKTLYGAFYLLLLASLLLMYGFRRGVAPSCEAELNVHE